LLKIINSLSLFHQNERNEENEDKEKKEIHVFPPSPIPLIFFEMGKKGFPSIYNNSTHLIS
jgi:hypothetical protein